MGLGPGEDAGEQGTFVDLDQSGKGGVDGGEGGPQHGFFFGLGVVLVLGVLLVLGGVVSSPPLHCGGGGFGGVGRFPESTQAFECFESLYPLVADDEAVDVGRPGRGIWWHARS